MHSVVSIDPFWNKNFSEFGDNASLHSGQCTRGDAMLQVLSEEMQKKRKDLMKNSRKNSIFENFWSERNCNYNTGEKENRLINIICNANKKKEIIIVW